MLLFLIETIDQFVMLNMTLFIDEIVNVYYVLLWALGPTALLV